MEGPAKKLDRAMLESVYVRLEKPIYNVVYRWLWNREDASDVVQEAFVRLWKMRRRVDLSSVDALVYRIALNLAASRRRSGKRWLWASLSALKLASSAAPSVETQAVREEEASRVRRAVESLPESLRRVITLCELAELSYEEVGRVLAIPAGTVGSRRHRALRLLRERLGGDPV